MKINKTLLGLFLVFLMVIFNSVINANLLKNPSFEENGGLGNTEVNNWEIVGGNVYHVYDKEVFDGEYSVKFWWEGKMSQQVSCKPNKEYVFRISVMNSAVEPLEGTKCAIVRLKFLDKNKRLVGKYQSEKFGKENKPGEWNEIKISGVSPEDATYAVCEISFVGGSGGGVIVFDKAELREGQSSQVKTKPKEETKKVIEGKNLLLNPSFEENDGLGNTEVHNWEIVGGNVYHVYDKEVFDGEYSVKFWWEGVMSQQLQCSPNIEYEFSVMMLNSDIEPLDQNGTKHAYLKMKFLDKNKNEIISHESVRFGKNYKPGQWQKIELVNVAPENAKYIIVEIIFKGGSGGGVVVFDKASLIEKQIKLEQKKYKKKLEGKWKIQKGDNLEWAKINFDDSQWEEIYLPGCIEEKYPTFLGRKTYSFVWLRKEVDLSDAPEGEPLFLCIGAIDDADEVYFNGKLIGTLGGVPPFYTTAWDKMREYLIPPELINRKKKNLIAIRLFNDLGRGGVTRRPLLIVNSYSRNCERMENLKVCSSIGDKIEQQEIDKTLQLYSRKFLRFAIKKLPNEGYCLVDNKKNEPFIVLSVEYEPLAMYGEMDWQKIERDFDLIKKCGFNTVTIWCMDFNASAGAGKRMSIEEMSKLAQLAQKKALLVQFYLNIDRFINLFPTATLPNGNLHGFDIDYCNDDYINFVKNFAKKLAISLYPYDNILSIIIWEEKVGLYINDFKTPKIIVETFFASSSGKEKFKRYLIEKHKTIEELNQKWKTNYKSFEEAVENSLKEYFEGVPDNDKRQFDILEFGTFIIADLAKIFVDEYKSIDSTVLFQCRQWDLFGPIRAVDPKFSFLDIFGVNSYSFGSKGADLSFREVVVKTKLISGVIGVASFLGNFGFRTNSWDGGTHGLVPNDKIKSQIAADSTIIFNSIPELLGTSYFQYFYKGYEGDFNLIENLDSAKPLPVYNSLEKVHSLLSLIQKNLAEIDYYEPPKVYIFHGLDAIYDLRQRSWIEHTTMVWDMLEMNLNYGVVSDDTELLPSKHPVVLCNFHVYDKKLDTKIVEKLLKYCESGGILVIGNYFGKYDRYLNENKRLTKILDSARGIKIGELKRDKITAFIPKDQNETVPITFESWYVVSDFSSVDKNVNVLLTIEIRGKKQPGLVCKNYGKGKIYYFLFNPYYQLDWWEQPEEKLSRTSFPILYFLFDHIGLQPDRNIADKGFYLNIGRINLYEKPIHYFIYKDEHNLFDYTDTYQSLPFSYGGGCILDNFISFFGKSLSERGFNITCSRPSSVYLVFKDGKTFLSTSEPVEINISNPQKKISVKTQTKSYEIYNFNISY